MKAIHRKLNIIALSLTLLVLTACGGTDPTPPAGTPAAPTNVTATPGPGYITVAWQDNSDNETGFAIFRSTTSASAVTTQQSGTKVGEVGVGEESFIDRSIEIGVNYNYSVKAMSENGSSEPAAPVAGGGVAVEPGVDLVAGTFNLATLENPFTSFLIYFHFPDDMRLTENFTISITGPDGWNDGAPYEILAGPALIESGSFIDFLNTAPVSGGYLVEVTLNGETFSKLSAPINSTQLLAVPENVTVTSASATEVTGSWDGVSGAVSYRAFIREDYTSFASPFIAYNVETTTSTTFNDLDLASGEYALDVTAFPVDLTYAERPVKPAQFNVSYNRSEPFTIGGGSSDACTNPDEAVNIPDSDLEAAIREELGKETGDLTCADMAALEELEAEDANISSLEGLQYAVNLEGLYLSDNAISDLSPLSGLENLEGLNLNENQVSDLSPLQSLTSLRGLYICCESNAYTDISPLAGLTNLENLDIGGHDLGDLSDIAGLDQLTRLWTWGNALGDDDITLLSSFDLELLNIEGNEFTDVSFVLDYPNLKSLDISWNPIEDPSVVFDLTGLVELGISDLGVSDISFLTEFTNLEEFAANENGISDISPLAGLTTLTVIELEANALNDLSALQGLTNLDFVLLEENLITDITPLVNNPGLGEGDYVDVSENYLDVSPGSDDLANIETLEARGVEIYYDSQSTPGETEERCEDWDRFNAGPYRYHNNVFGKGDITDYEQCMLRRVSDDGVQYGWTWNWPAADGRNKAHPEIVFGMSPYWELNGRTTTMLPVRYSDIASLTVSYDLTMTTTGEQGLNLVTCHTRTNPPTPESIAHCVTIYFSNDLFDVSTGQDVTIGTNTYKLFVGSEDEEGDFNIYLFTQGIDAKQHTLDIKEVLDYLVSQGITQGSFEDTYLTGLEFGNLVRSGTGTTWINEYNVELEVN